MLQQLVYNIMVVVLVTADGIAQLIYSINTAWICFDVRRICVACRVYLAANVISFV